jgi:hypothetical protein
MQVLRSGFALLMLGMLLAACAVHDRPYRTYYYSAGPPPPYGPDYNRPDGCWHCW